MSAPATLRAAAAIVQAAADRAGHEHWHRIADNLNKLADEMTPDQPENPAGADA